MLKLFRNLRLIAFFYSAVMLAAIESVGIITQGEIELEHDNREAYASILIASLSSYITEKSIIYDKNTTDS